MFNILVRKLLAFILSSAKQQTQPWATWNKQRYRWEGNIHDEFRTKDSDLIEDNCGIAGDGGSGKEGRGKSDMGYGTYALRETDVVLGVDCEERGHGMGAFYASITRWTGRQTWRRWTRGHCLGRQSCLSTGRQRAKIVRCAKKLQIRALKTNSHL